MVWCQPPRKAEATWPFADRSTAGRVALIRNGFSLGHPSTGTAAYQLPEEGQAPSPVVVQVRDTLPLPGFVIVKLLPEADLATTS
jgi:hypothetical protein